MKELVNYCVGPLLYCPANNQSIVHSLTEQKFGSHFSLALCLEDTIKDDCVTQAEHILISSLNHLLSASGQKQFFIPQIFIRIRNAEHMLHLYQLLGELSSIISGFILPKFSLSNADDYIQTILFINQTSSKPLYMMPIMESLDMIALSSRFQILYSLKEKLDSVSDYVRNVRVGGNDLCHCFGFRRSSTESIYGIHSIASILSDIMTVFGMDYVVSGPVWEYYSGSNWDTGLTKELRDDRLNGFVGKTVIHPNQIELVNKAYQVSAEDFADACSILNWDPHSSSLVSGSRTSGRMNEYKTHSNWAKKILMLSKAYGIQDSQMQDKQIQDGRIQDKQMQDKQVQDKQIQDSRIQDNRMQGSRIRSARETGSFQGF